MISLLTRISPDRAGQKGCAMYSISSKAGIQWIPKVACIAAPPDAVTLKNCNTHLLHHDGVNQMHFVFHLVVYLHLKCWWCFDFSCGHLFIYGTFFVGYMRVRPVKQDELMLLGVLVINLTCLGSAAEAFCPWLFFCAAECDVFLSAPRASDSSNSLYFADVYDYVGRCLVNLWPI